MAEMLAVTSDVSPRKMFVPWLMSTAMPIVMRNSTGSKYDGQAMSRIVVTSTIERMNTIGGISGVEVSSLRTATS